MSVASKKEYERLMGGALKGNKKREEKEKEFQVLNLLNLLTNQAERKATIPPFTPKQLDILTTALKEVLAPPPLTQPQAPPPLTQPQIEEASEIMAWLLSTDSQTKPPFKEK